MIEVYIALALFDLFRGVDRRLALRMLALGLLPVPIVFLNVLPAYAAITAATGDALPDRDTAVRFLHDLHQTGIVIAGVFWGLWLFPLGRLILASRLMPRLLGLSVMAGGAGYLLRALAMLALPDSAAAETASGLLRISEMLMLGEVPVIFGLLWLGFAKRK